MIQSNIKYTNIFKKNNIDNYVVIFDKKNNNINKFKSIPKIFFKDLIDKNSKITEKVFYSNNSSIHFYLYESNEINNKLFGMIGKNSPLKPSFLANS